MESIVRDPSLADPGEERLAWAAAHMPVLGRLRSAWQVSRPLAGRRISMCLHLEAKTAILALTLQDAGAEVAIAGSNPLSTQDEVAAALARRGPRVFAWRGATPDEYQRFVELVGTFGPDLVLDDGADLSVWLHQRPDLIGRVQGITEETTTGLRRLSAMERQGVLACPVIAVNDARSKHLFDNRYGTGQSVWDAICRTTNLLVAGRVVVVAGYGWCGKGIALRARGLGARVVVCEVDPVAVNEALMEGFAVMPMAAAAALGDVFITATGCRGVVREEHFRVMREGAILANAGHFDVEVDVAALRRCDPQPVPVRPGVLAFRVAGRTLYLLGEGRLVNLACGDGHPAEIMDMSFAVQAQSLAHLAESGGRLPRRVLPVPAAVDQAVAAQRLAALGVEHDQLSPGQSDYLAAWR